MSPSIWKYVVAAACIGGAIVAFGAAVCTASGCASAPAPAAADLSAYLAEQMACVNSSDTRLNADQCRAESRAKWCGKFPAATNCTQDGGGQ